MDLFRNVGNGGQYADNSAIVISYGFVTYIAVARPVFIRELVGHICIDTAFSLEQSLMDRIARASSRGNFIELLAACSIKIQARQLSKFGIKMHKPHIGVVE